MVIKLFYFVQDTLYSFIKYRDKINIYFEIAKKYNFKISINNLRININFI